jgi:hypothetical protein
MPDGIEQYFALPLRERAMIMWLLVDRMFDVSEEEREALLPNVDWENAGALCVCPFRVCLLFVGMCTHVPRGQRGLAATCRFWACWHVPRMQVLVHS